MGNNNRAHFFSEDGKTFMIRFLTLVSVPGTTHMGLNRYLFLKSTSAWTVHLQSKSQSEKGPKGKFPNKDDLL